MEYSFKQQLPYIVATIAVGIMLNYALDGTVVLSKIVWLVPISALSLYFIRWLQPKYGEFEISTVFKKYWPQMIYLPIAGCCWQWYTYKCISISQVLLYFVSFILLFVVMERSTYD